MVNFEKASLDNKFDHLDSSKDSALMPNSQIKILGVKVLQITEKINGLKQSLNIIAEEDSKALEGDIVNKGFELKEAETELASLQEKIKNINELKTKYSNIENDINSAASKN